MEDKIAAHANREDELQMQLNTRQYRVDVLRDQIQTKESVEATFQRQVGACGFRIAIFASFVTTLSLLMFGDCNGGSLCRRITEHRACLSQACRTLIE